MYCVLPACNPPQDVRRTTLLAHPRLLSLRIQPEAAWGWGAGDLPHALAVIILLWFLLISGPWNQGQTLECVWGVRRWKLGPNCLNWFHRAAAFRNKQARTMSSQYPVLIWGKLSVTNFTHDSLEAKHGRSAPASLRAPLQSAWKDEAQGQAHPSAPSLSASTATELGHCTETAWASRVSATHQERLVHVLGMLSLTNEAQRLINSTGFFH